MTEKTFQISLSGDALAWLEAEIRDGTYRDESEMLQALVQRDLDALGALILEGEASGISGRNMRDVMNEIKAKRTNEAA
jgi:Arc/MetJ-type ribon-helix-helix transcriptional regulator